MSTFRTPQKSRIHQIDSPTPSSLRSPSPSQPPAVSRIQRPTASASPQIKAALAALRKNRPISKSPSLNSDSPTSSATPDPFSTPPRASTSKLDPEQVESPGFILAGDQIEEGNVNWAKKNENKLIEGAKKSGILNLASQGLERVTPAVYIALLPRSSPYHPSRRHRSTYKPEPTKSFSFSRDDSETAWFEQRDLKSLNLANNELKSVDEEVGGFEDLEHLDLHGNSLTSIPSSLGFLINLTSLNLASNSIARFPVQIVNLRYLRDLDLSHNKLENLWTSSWEEDLTRVLQPPEASPSATPESPERIRDFFAASPSKRSQPELANSSSTSPFPLLQILKLSGSAFDKSTFTSDGFEFPPQLRTLDLSSSQVVDSSLPPDLLGRLKQLSELDLSDNALTEDLFSLDLFPLDSPEPLFPSLRLLYLSLNPIENLESIEEFLTEHVSRPIEYVGLPKLVLNLVKSEEQRLRGGKRIGIKLEGETDVGPEVEIRVLECPLEGEQERRRAKFPTKVGVASNPSSTMSGLSVPPPPQTQSASASPSSSPPRSSLASPSSPAAEPPPTSHSTPSRKQVVLEQWEIEAAAGLTTPAGRRKAAAQAAREAAERKRQEEEEKRQRMEERARKAQVEAESKQRQKAEEIEKKMRDVTLEDAAQEVAGDERTSRSPSPPPYSPRKSTDSSSLPPTVDDKSHAPSSSLPIADPSDPAFFVVTELLNTSTRTVNLSSRSLSSLPTLTTGSPPSFTPQPLALDLSRNVLTYLPLASIESWQWTSTLRTLTVTHNRLSTLLDPKEPTSFSPLPSLTTLDLSNNQLTSASSCSSSSKPLLSQIHDLFPSLRSLTLSYNRLESLEGIGTLLLPSDDKTVRPQLRVLSLNGNKISDTTALCRVAEQLGESGATAVSKGMWNLEELDLRDNEIARLQPTLGLLPHSLILSVSGNTFRFPRREIWENPGQRLLLPNLRERLG
ncbi:hypothetical protein JCM5350_000063 [Sporobolomyces pararoseus]